MSKEQQMGLLSEEDERKLEYLKPGPPEKLLPGFGQGYVQALLDVDDQLQWLIRDDFNRLHLQMNSKRALQFMKLYMEHFVDIRIQRGFIRWNTQKKDLEFFIQSQKYWRL